MADTAVTYSAVGALFVFCGLLVKLLWKFDDRWVKIVDAKDEVIEKLEEKVTHLVQENEGLDRTIGALRRTSWECERLTSELSYKVDVLQRQLAEAMELPHRHKQQRTRKDDGG